MVELKTDPSRIKIGFYLEDLLLSYKDKTELRIHNKQGEYYVDNIYFYTTVDSRNRNNKLLRRGVEREIEIIGEAMTRLLKINPKLVTVVK